MKPQHNCPHCGRFADMDSGYYARPPSSPDCGFVRVYCDESHYQAHEFSHTREALAFDGISVESSHAGLRLSTMTDGRRVSRLYQGYTLPEAGEAFAAELAGLPA